MSWGWKGGTIKKRMSKGDGRAVTIARGMILTCCGDEKKLKREERGDRGVLTFV